MRLARFKAILWIGLAGGVSMGAVYREIALPKWERVFRLVSDGLGILFAAYITSSIVIVPVEDGAFFKCKSTDWKIFPHGFSRSVQPGKAFDPR